MSAIGVRNTTPCEGITQQTPAATTPPAACRRHDAAPSGPQRVQGWPAAPDPRRSYPPPPSLQPKHLRERIKVCERAIARSREMLESARGALERSVAGKREESKKNHAKRLKSMAQLDQDERYLKELLTETQKRDDEEIRRDQSSKAFKMANPDIWAAMAPCDAAH